MQVEVRFKMHCPERVSLNVHGSVVAVLFKSRDIAGICIDMPERTECLH